MDDAFINGQEKLGETGFVGITFSILGAHQRSLSGSTCRTAPEAALWQKVLLLRRVLFAGTPSLPARGSRSLK